MPVVFRIDSLATWDKKRSIYFEMSRNPRFAPLVAVTPGKWFSPEQSAPDEVKKIVSALESEGISALDATFLKPRDLMGPLGLIVDDDPWEYQKPKAWSPARFSFFLWIIVPYTMGVTVSANHYATSRPFVRAWRVFYPTRQLLDYSKNCSFRAQINGRFVGYPVIDDLLTVPPVRQSSSVKLESKFHPVSRPILLWAPHWTISDGPGNLSAFLEWHETILHMAKNGDSPVQWVFRPHPLLEGQLMRSWGEKMANAYFSEWVALCGPWQSYSYLQIFAESSGLVHDSASFLGEYLFTRKPAAFTERSDGGHLGVMNSVGVMCLDAHYKVKSELDLRDFIGVACGSRQDELKTKRESTASSLGSIEAGVAHRLVGSIAVDLTL